jgi:hypothetical protein
MNIQSHVNKLQGYSESRHKNKGIETMRRIKHNQSVQDLQAEFAYWSNEFDSVLDEINILRGMRS